MVSARWAAGITLAEPTPAATAIGRRLLPLTISVAGVTAKSIRLFTIAEVAEPSAHAIGNAVEAAYRRGDLFEKRRHLMNDWAAFCECVAVGGAIPLRRVAQ